MRATRWVALILSLIAAAVLSARSNRETVLTLWSSGNARLTIVSPQGDVAAERLQLRLAERGVHDVSWKAFDDGTGNVIFVGTPETNHALQSFLRKKGKPASYQGLQDEEYRIRSQAEGRRVVIVATGGGAAGSLYAVGDLVNYHLRFLTDKVEVPASLDLHESPRMKLRFFWNWDRRTHWDLSPDRPTRETSKYGYPGTTETFRRDMSSMIDFMSEHKINAVALWGFLRDEHGGVPASQQMCEYANKRGVKILPGIGVDSSGGFYVAGDNKFSIDTWTAQHPELRAMDKQGRYVDRAICMDKEANRQWFREGIRWLFETFPIAGVNMEFGEFRVCYCPDSVKAREAVLPQERANMLENARRLAPSQAFQNSREYYVDLGRIVSWAAKETHAVRPRALITYAAYTGFDESMRQNPPYFLNAIPPYAIVQWTLTDMVKGNYWVEGLKSPVSNAIGFLHAGGTNPAIPESNAILYPRLAQAAAKAYAAGLQGFGIYGELSAQRAISEFNYLVFSEFGFNPEMSEEEFVRTRLAPYYGGESQARQLLKMVRLIGFRRDGDVPETLDEALHLARQARDATTQGIARNRWERWIAALQSLGKGR